MKPCHTELFAANGSQINVLCSVCLNVVVNGLFLPTELLVTDETDVILGYSFLCENACQWNFDIAMLMVRGTPVRLLKRSSAQCSFVRRIYVKETTDVPTNVTINVPVRLPACSRYTVSGENWVIDPREIRPGLLLSRCLLSDDNDFSAVQILNISGKPHTLPANLKLGDAGVGQCLGSLSQSHEETRQNECFDDYKSVDVEEVKSVRFDDVCDSSCTGNLDCSHGESLIDSRELFFVKNFCSEN